MPARPQPRYKNITVCTDCTTCGTTDDACTRGIHSGQPACCTDCYRTDTHHAIADPSQSVPEGPRTFGSAVALLGKQVEVTLAREGKEPAVVTRGQLLSVGDDGQIVTLDDGGFVAYSWPMLDIKEVET